MDDCDCRWEYSIFAIEKEDVEEEVSFSSHLICARRWMPLRRCGRSYHLLSRMRMLSRWRGSKLPVKDAVHLIGREYDRQGKCCEQQIVHIINYRRSNHIKWWSLSMASPRIIFSRIASEVARFTFIRNIAKHLLQTWFSSLFMAS